MCWAFPASRSVAWTFDQTLCRCLHGSVLLVNSAAKCETHSWYQCWTDVPCYSFMMVCMPDTWCLLHVKKSPHWRFLFKIAHRYWPTECCLLSHVDWVNLDLCCDLSQALVGEVRHRLGCMEPVAHSLQLAFRSSGDSISLGASLIVSQLRLSAYTNNGHISLSLTNI